MANYEKVHINLDTSSEKEWKTRQYTDKEQKLIKKFEKKKKGRK